MRPYELRPKTDPLLTQGGLTAQLQHGVLGLCPLFGLRSHGLRPYELRPKTDPLLTQGGLTAQLQHGVLQLYRFFPK